MVASGTGIRCEYLAQGLFEALTQFCLAVPRSRRRDGELKELEFLALALLSRHEPQIVGELQRQLGILPAQMSRVIRSLEDRDRPLIGCRINPADKRKIDVGLTDEGARACRDHQRERVVALARIFSELAEDERDDFARLLDRFRDLADTLLHARHEDERVVNGASEN